MELTIILNICIVLVNLKVLDFRYSYDYLKSCRKMYFIQQDYWVFCIINCSRHVYYILLQLEVVRFVLTMCQRYIVFGSFILYILYYCIWHLPTSICSILCELTILKKFEYWDCAYKKIDLKQKIFLKSFYLFFNFIKFYRWSKTIVSS